MIFLEGWQQPDIFKLMSTPTIKDRISSYEEIYNYKLLPKLPVIIQVNGRSFYKATAFLDKPYCEVFADTMASTMLQLCLEIEGAIFAYQYNDQIIIIARNDQNQDTIPWYDNKIQKISSVASSIATFHFNNISTLKSLNLVGDSIFLAQTFNTPSIIEAIHAIVLKQQQNFQNAVQAACFYELIKKHNKETIKDMLSGLTIDEKIDILYQECSVSFNEYPTAFKRGIACYRSPKIVNDLVKNKWVINKELPIFTQDHSLLANVFQHGSDILRKE